MTKNSKNIFIGLAALVVVVALILLQMAKSPNVAVAPVAPSPKTGIKSPTSTPEEIAKATVTIQVAKDQLPEGIPSDIPQEAGAEILNNFQASNSLLNLTQSTRIFVTKKTLQQNFDIYKAYLDKNVWQITASSSSQSDVKAILGTKGIGQLSIVASLDSAAKRNIVNISFNRPLTGAGK